VVLLLGVAVVVLGVAVLAWVAQALGFPKRREWAGKNEIVVVTRWEWPVLIAAGDPETRRALPSIVFQHTGRYRVAVAPGWSFWIGRHDQVHRFDVRGWAFTTDAVEMLSNDLVPVTVTASLAVQVVDPILAVTKPSSWESALKRAANGAVRPVVARFKVSELVTRRAEVNDALVEQLTAAATGNGFRLVRFDLVDVVLPKELHRSLARVAEAEREALAVAIAAQGERDAAALFADAAARMGDDRTSFELRVLRMLQAVATEDGTTVVGPPFRTPSVDDGPLPPPLPGTAGPAPGAAPPGR
jgi:hypothetical protein